MRMLTVVLIDRHELFRTGLHQLLEADRVAIVGEASTIELGMRLVELHAPDVVVVDPDTPSTTGLSPLGAIRRLQEQAPDTHLLALGRTQPAHDPVEIVRIGGSCYLSKDAPPETVLAGVHAAAASETLIAPAIAAALVRRLRAIGAGEGPAPQSVLSEREQEVLRLIAGGLDNDAIAGELFISRHTVKNHISNILLKLEVTNRVQAAVRAAQEAMI